MRSDVSSAEVLKMKKEVMDRLAAKHGLVPVPGDEREAARLLNTRECPAGWKMVDGGCGGWDPETWYKSSSCCIYEGDDGDGGRPGWYRRKDVELVERARFLGWELVSPEEVSQAVGRTPASLGWKYVHLGGKADDLKHAAPPHWRIEDPRTSETYGKSRGLFKPIQNFSHMQDGANTQGQDAMKKSRFPEFQTDKYGNDWRKVPVRYAETMYHNNIPATATARTVFDPEKVGAATESSILGFIDTHNYDINYACYVRDSEYGAFILRMDVLRFQDRKSAPTDLLSTISTPAATWHVISDEQTRRAVQVGAYERNFMRLGLRGLPFCGLDQLDGEQLDVDLDELGEEWALYYQEGKWQQVIDYLDKLEKDQAEKALKEDGMTTKTDTTTTAMTFSQRAGAFGKEVVAQGMGMAAGMTAVDALQYSIESTLGVGTKTWFKVFQKGKLARMYLHVKKMRGGNRAIRLVLSAIIGVASLVATKQAKGEEVAPILALLPNILARMGIRVAVGAAASEVAFAVQEAVYAAGPLLKQWFDTPIGEEVKEAIVESFAEEDRVGVREALRQVQQGRTM